MASVTKTYLLFLFFLPIILSPSVISAQGDIIDPKPEPGANDGGSDYTKPELETAFLGQWVIDNPNAGVAAMQLQLMPNDQVIWFDTTSLGPSGFKLPEGTECPINPEANNQPDCFAHAIAYDWKTSKYRPLTVCFYIQNSTL